ncbi:D-glycero-D-manno-heptose-7-phosphate 1-kinase [Granulibacter bethesdensis CGDNIH4]|nr:D-glycero-D-manno-heptose-7-phosphate 1-kinase [Granulibacter bethesdensis CGDNIH4]
MLPMQATMPDSIPMPDPQRSFLRRAHAAMRDDWSGSTGSAPAVPTLPGLPKFHQASLLVVGDVMMDEYISGPVRDGLQEPSLRVLRADEEMAVPGGAGTVLRCLTALGAAVAFVSLVGDDQTGSDLTGLVGSQPGVEPWLLVEGGRITTRKTRYMADGQQILRVDREIREDIQDRLSDRLLRIARDAMAATSITVLADYGNGLLSGPVISGISLAARAAGRPLVVAPSLGRSVLFAGADIIVPGRRELSHATGLACETPEQVEIAAAELRARFGHRAVMALRQDGGLTLADESGTRTLGTIAGEKARLSGVTEAVVATVSAALAAGCAIERAAELGNIAAGLTATRLRPTTVPQPAELAAAIA